MPREDVIAKVADADRRAMQDRVTARHGGWAIGAKRRTLCARCAHYETGGKKKHCRHGLLPLTLDGGDCPYWKEVQRE